MSTPDGSSISADSIPTASKPNIPNGKAQPDGVLTSPTPSSKPVYTSPPAVKVPYDPHEALDDIPGVAYALELFLASHMVESEEYCHKMDENKYIHFSLSV